MRQPCRFFANAANQLSPPWRASAAAAVPRVALVPRHAPWQRPQPLPPPIRRLPCWDRPAGWTAKRKRRAPRAAPEREFLRPATYNWETVQRAGSTEVAALGYPGAALQKVTARP